jgi:hypothetical protein
MTAPLQPSATTAPVRDRAYWTTVLHNAAQVPVDHPRYGDARSVIQMALDNMQTAADSAYDKEIKDISPGPVGTALVSFGHGASLGLAGDRTYLQLARQANPKTAFISDLAGTAATATIASPLVAGLSPAAGGAVLGAGTMGIRGAVEPIPGLTRGESALASGTLGAVTGAVAGKIVSKLVPMARTISQNVARMLGRSASPAEVGAVSEAAVRAQLQKLNVSPEVLERTIQAWKTGTIPITPIPASPPAPIEPVAMRPGTTVVPLEPQIPAARAAAADPLNVPAFMRNAPPPGEGPAGLPGALARGVGGHSYSGTYPAGTTAGMPSGAGSPTSPDVAAMQLRQLHLLSQLPEADFEAAASLFPKAIIDQLRLVRAQFPPPVP